MDRISTFEQALKSRILLLDGSTGVEFQAMRLEESDVRGRRFMTHTHRLAANFDILCLSRPDLVGKVHDSYLSAGADIIETNTFNANRLSQREYATDGLIRELNISGARIARKEADRYTALNPSKPRFVAGSMGPTAMSASLPVDVNDPAARSVDFDTLAEAYAEQADGLVEGGADLLLIETAFDLLNAKAAAEGAMRAFDTTGRRLPIIFSFTISDASGRILSGHTPDAILATVAPFEPAALGFNCSAGPEGLAAVVRDLSSRSPFPVIFYPNAGMPDRMGRYTVTPEDFAAAMRPLIEHRQVNIVGGCCGTNPGHIRALAEVIRECGDAPRTVPDSVTVPWLVGLEAFDDNRGFINVGERCNVAGSRKFLRLIKEGNIDEAVAIARKQVADGAMILDINMDDGMLDAPKEMRRFLRALGADPATSTVPWMIDSSDFAAIEDSLKNIGGRAIVNSISLKHGEEEFLRQARTIRRYGAAVVVMLFDERGQADTLERKIEIADRAVRLLHDKAGMAMRDIVIDPNVLTIATGMPEHDAYAAWFIEAVRHITTRWPGVKTSGGVSNLSFAFRGNNYLRQAMHAVFLYHGIRAGLSMGIVDPGTKVTYADIPDRLLRLIEAAVLNTHSGACDELSAAAAEWDGKGETASATTADATDRSATDVGTRLAEALLRGDDSHLTDDLMEAIPLAGSAQAVVERYLMEGMEEVGRRFEAGKMFLPQVVKSARTMHRAVEILTPYLEENSATQASKGRFLVATVRGDVHDIGKNIVSVVLRCNGFEVIDLGVQVDAATIVDGVRRHKPDFIGLSGLIAPSLEEMAKTLTALLEAGITTPVFVGGAATSEIHTALRLSPAYGGNLVVRMSDAAQNPVVASRLLSDSDTVTASIMERRSRLVSEYQRHNVPSSDDSGHQSGLTDWSAVQLTAPAVKGITTLDEITLAEVRPYINWIYFNHCWRVRPDSPESRELTDDANRLLDSLEADGATMRAQVAFYDACSDGDSIIIDHGRVTIPTPRQRQADRLSLADFVAPHGYGDHIGCFVVTLGQVLRRKLDEQKNLGDEYTHLLLQSVCDRLAEATSEFVHRRVRTELWGYAPDEPADLQAIRQGRYRGIRPAVGYPSLPDQRQMHTLLSLLDPQAVEVTATDNGALMPSSSVAGFYIAAPHARYFSV